RETPEAPADELITGLAVELFVQLRQQFLAHSRIVVIVEIAVDRDRARTTTLVWEKGQRSAVPVALVDEAAAEPVAGIAQPAQRRVNRSGVVAGIEREPGEDRTRPVLALHVEGVLQRHAVFVVALIAIPLDRGEHATDEPVGVLVVEQEIPQLV